MRTVAVANLAAASRTNCRTYAAPSGGLNLATSSSSSRRRRSSRPSRSAPMARQLAGAGRHGSRSPPAMSKLPGGGRNRSTIRSGAGSPPLACDWPRGIDRALAVSAGAPCVRHEVVVELLRAPCCRQPRRGGQAVRESPSNWRRRTGSCKRWPPRVPRSSSWSNVPPGGRRRPGWTGCVVRRPSGRGSSGGGAGPTETLTERERDVLRFLPSRLTLREIADELYVSPNTLKFHLKVIYRKLGVNSRAGRRRRSSPDDRSPPAGLAPGTVRARAPWPCDVRTPRLSGALGHAGRPAPDLFDRIDEQRDPARSSSRLPHGGRVSRSVRSRRDRRSRRMSASCCVLGTGRRARLRLRAEEMRSPAMIRPPTSRAASDSGSAQRSSATTTTPAVPGGKAIEASSMSCSLSSPPTSPSTAFSEAMVSTASTSSTDTAPSSSLTKTTRSRMRMAAVVATPASAGATLASASRSGTTTIRYSTRSVNT